MNVLLIRPKPHKNTIGLQNIMICEPLELEYIASNIEANGHNATIIDMILEKKSITYFIDKYKPDIVGITGYITHVNIVKNYAEKIKKIDSKITVIVGGVHAEVNPKDFESEYIDYIIRANGIQTFNYILDNIKSKKNCNNNCIYSKDGDKPQKSIEFNYLFPDRNKVSKYRNKYYYMFHRNCSLIKTSFGCPYNCKFCFCTKITDGNYNCRNLENVIEEIKTIKEKEIYIVDDDFLVSKERILSFCNMLKENKIDKRYLIYARADFIANNENVIEEFKNVGLRAVIIGLESCEPSELNDYNKKTNVSTNEEAVKILKKYDVECYGSFILGLDWEKKDFKNLEKWIKKLGIVFINLQPLTPLRGTDVYEKYKSEFIVKEEDYELWDLAHLVIKPSKISIRKYYYYTMMLYYKIMVNPKSALYMIKKYGIKDTLKLSIGAIKVNIQYLKKLIGGK